MRYTLKVLKKKHPARTPASSPTIPEEIPSHLRATINLRELHCLRPPAAQNLVDIFPGGWLTGFPPEYNVTAGPVSYFDFKEDPRVAWAGERISGGLRGAKVLELGPFEAYNTWQLEQLGAEVVAVESSKVAFLKCLLVKEITGLRASFLHGDALGYLEEVLKDGRRFDAVWASGILYHQTEPLRLLSLITRLTGTIFIHTHYYDEAAVRSNPAVAERFDPSTDEVLGWDGFEAVHHRFSYRTTDQGPFFAAGPAGFSRWLEQKDIFAFLERAGFTKIDIEVDNLGHPNGPGMCFLAEKP